jgi:hypothetical protein
VTKSLKKLTPLVEKIALCAAGLESQSVFDAATHPYAGVMDEARIIELTEDLDEESRLAQRDDGYRRAHNLIKAHTAKVDQLAKNLLAKRSLTQTEVCSLLECKI